MEKGLEQRVRALNLFLHDVYHEGKILDDGVVPRDLVMNAPAYRQEFRGADVPHDLYVHICGTDLIRDDRDGYMVLEDNCRTPSGVSYMLENREVLMRALPESFRDYRVRPNDGYAAQLLTNLMALAKRPEPNVVLLTPGVFNSAYFEHAYLAQQMGIELVEGRDLYVEDNFVYMKATTRAEAGGRGLPPRGRRLPRPAGVPKGERAGRPGHRERLPRGQRRAGERHRDGRGRRQGGLSLRPRDDQVLPGRGRPSSRRSPPTSAGAPPTWTTSSPTCRTSS